MEPKAISPLPKEFLARLARLVSEDRYNSITDALSETRPTTFRINTLKATPDEVTRMLHMSGFVLDPIPWNDGAFVLKNKSLKELSETPVYTEGKIYVQSLSSMVPPLILHPVPGSRVLDIAAAPGSKTTQLAAMMNNSGEIIANDTSRERTYRLIANLKNQGVTIAKTAKIDGRALWQHYMEYFDYVLADVPCSMEGRFNTSDEKTYQDWSLKKVKDLSHLQRWILRSAVSSAKPGGMIVYSTCTISPEENEEVVDWILEKEKGNVRLEEVVLPGYSFDPAVRRFGSREYDASIGNAARIYPTPRMEGFFVAKLKKIKSSVPHGLRTQNAV